jgi:hypothetical protein
VRNGIQNEIPGCRMEGRETKKEEDTVGMQVRGGGAAEKTGRERGERLGKGWG